MIDRSCRLAPQENQFGARSSNMDRTNIDNGTRGIDRRAHPLRHQPDSPFRSPNEHRSQAEENLGVQSSRLPLPAELPPPAEWGPPSGLSLPSEWALPLFDFGAGTEVADIAR